MLTLGTDSTGSEGGRIMKSFNLLVLGVVAAAMASLLSASAVRADPIRGDCLSVIRGANARSYDNKEHRLWYRRFWTGQCSGLPIWRCLSGDPKWNTEITGLLRRAPVGRKKELLASLCRLGQTIGYEWAKDNAIRCIHTRDAKKWGAMLRRRGDVFARVARIRRLANGRLGCR